jgi:hypothetical protein
MGAFSKAWAGHVRKMDHEAIVGFIGALRNAPMRTSSIVYVHLSCRSGML